LLDGLEAMLLRALPDFEKAPWGWDAADLASRADRDRPVVPREEAEPKIDPRSRAVVDQWQGIGLPLTHHPPFTKELERVADPRGILDAWYHRPAGHVGGAPTRVLLCRDGDVAHDVFLRTREHTQRAAPQHDINVFRFGSVVVWTRFIYPDAEAKLAGRPREGLNRLGPPDEHWSSQSPPVLELTPEVLATRVRLSRDAAGTHGDCRALVARTQETLRDLASMIQDRDVRDLVLATDTRIQTLIMLRVSQRSRPCPRYR
jgi:hypothetical protein